MSKDIHVLVVEDEPLLRLNIVDNLADAGFVVSEASNASEAIMVLNQNHDIRLVFTDVDMPGSMDGIRLAAYIRDRWPPLKIIVTSGYRRVSDGDIPPESHFFSKPYDPRKIVRSMQQMLTS
ncbi:MAG TPA: response regulator [Pseudorhizobium sp.]|jgi:CheY-like chemotaxis protein|nr:response regulator [Pseudorhizobium sp.]